MFRLSFRWPKWARHSLASAFVGKSRQRIELLRPCDCCLGWCTSFLCRNTGRTGIANAKPESKRATFFCLSSGRCGSNTKACSLGNLEKIRNKAHNETRTNGFKARSLFRYLRHLYIKLLGNNFWAPWSTGVNIQNKMVNFKGITH
jgi:hypothetical protein